MQEAGDAAEAGGIRTETAAGAGPPVAPLFTLKDREAA